MHMIRSGDAGMILWGWVGLGWGGAVIGIILIFNCKGFGVCVCMCECVLFQREAGKGMV